MADEIKAKFTLGRIVATPGAIADIPADEIYLALFRHSQGDWGILDAEDLQSNERALMLGGRLFSQYFSSKSVKFWIITESDRSVTNVELHISHLMLSLQKC